MAKHKSPFQLHLGKRAFFELLGLSLIIAISVSQRELLAESLRAIGSSNPYYLLLALSVFWVSLPLTAMSYQQLTKKSIPMLTTTLAQLAGSGPGRIIPGGFGRLGMIILHLKKAGIPMQIGIVASAMNGAFGVIVSTIVLVAVMSTHPDIQQHFSYGKGVVTLILLTIPLFIIFALYEIATHTKRGKKPMKKLSKEWRVQLSLLRDEPARTLKLTVIALIILASNVAILAFCALAVGSTLDINDAVIALSIGVFIGGILPTPGGLGGVEAGTASALIALGYDATTATTVAVLFRVITYWQPLVPGTIAYLYLREKKLA